MPSQQQQRCQEEGIIVMTRLSAWEAGTAASLDVAEGGGWGEDEQQFQQNWN